MIEIIKKFWPILTIFGLWFIFSSPYFLKGLVPFPSTYQVTFFPPWSASYGMPVKNNAMPDVITQMYPWKKLTIETWKKGVVPLWNPYSFSGTPHAGNYQSAVFTPFNLLFFILPFIDAWSILILAQPLLAGLFMLLYLSALKKSAFAVTIGAIAFMFCGFITVWMAYGTLGYAVLYLPLGLFAIHKYRESQNFWAPLLLAVSIVLSLVSGHFQMSLYVIITIFAYIIFSFLRRNLWKHGLILILYTLAGIALAAPQILLTFASYTQAIRSGLFSKGEIIPFGYLVALFAPDFYGNPVTRNDWFGHYAEWASFVGVGTLLLALWGLWQKKLRDHWFWIGLALVTLLLACPTPLNDLLFLAKIPVLSTSSASRIIILFSFSISVLAAYGFDSLLHRAPAQSKKSLIRFSFFVGLFLAIYWTVLLFGEILPADKLMIAKRNSVLPSGFAIAGLMLFWILVKLKNQYKYIASILFILLIAFEVLRFSSKWMPFDPREFVFPDLPVTSYLSKTIGSDRVFGNYGGEMGVYFSVSSLEGYDAVYSGRYGRFVHYVNHGNFGEGERSIALVGKNGKHLEETLQLLGVRYVLHRIGDGRNVWAYAFWDKPYYKQVHKDNDYEVYEHTDAYPRAFLASAYVVIPDEKEALTKLFDTTTNRREILTLETEPDIKPEEGSGSAQITRYEPNVVTVRTESDVNKLLFLSDAFDVGWQATIDGKKTTVYRADYDFRAVAVPAGTHEIEFQYNPDGFTFGAIVSLVSLSSLILGTILLKKKQQKI